MRHYALNLTAGSAISFLPLLDLTASHPSKCSPSTSALAYETVPENLWSANMVCSPLARSVEYFQDQLFAPRRLHFGEDQTFWQCAELKACESFHDGLPQQLLQNHVNDSISERMLKQVQMLLKAKLPMARAHSQQGSLVPWMMVWHQLVNQ